jgi:hypothetical protein
MKGATLVVALAAAGAGVSVSDAAPRHSASAAAHPAASRGASSGPVAVYWMSASTTTGMGGPSGVGGAGGGRPNMAMMMRGGAGPNAVSHALTLQLGSTRHADGEPTAEHDPPEGLGAGPMLPLVTPQAQPAHEETPPGPPERFQRPHGRMLIFWGCGEHAGPGQPYVIDFASLAGPAAAQKFAGLMRGIAVTPMEPPSPGRYATYGEWPNERSDSSVPPSGSLAGDHLVKGNYTPDIRFGLTPQQDFLPAFNLTTNQKNPSGSASLGWQAMQGVQGYFATMIGAQGEDQVVMWTSSATQAPAFGMPDYLSDGEIARLVGSHVLMPPSQTQCTIPVEAVQAAGQGGFFQLVGYGGEANFAYPPRPPAPQPWHVDWTVKVRYRTSTGGLVGMDLGRMMGGNDDDNDQRGRRQQQQQQHHGFGIPGLGSFIP